MDVGDGFHNQEQHNHAPDGIGRSGAVVLCVLCGLGLGMAIYSQIEAAKAERETRLLEYYVMELDGKLMKQGVIDPSESWSAKQKEKAK